MRMKTWHSGVLSGSGCNLEASFINVLQLDIATVTFVNEIQFRSALTVVPAHWINWFLSHFDHWSECYCSLKLCIQSKHKNKLHYPTAISQDLNLKFASDKQWRGCDGKLILLLISCPHVFRYTLVFHSSVECPPGSACCLL